MRVDSRAKRVALKDMMRLNIRTYLLKEFNDRRLEISIKRR